MEALGESLKNKKILIAEDSAVTGVMLKRILTGNGFRIVWAKSGTEAAQELKKNIPDLVISDVEMPGMNGFELCSLIKNDETLKKIPVILCTSLSEPEDLIRGIESGADGYITKPYDELSLLLRIESLLSNPTRLEHQPVSPVRITYAGKEYSIVADRLHILNLLL